MIDFHDLPSDVQDHPEQHFLTRLSVANEQHHFAFSLGEEPIGYALLDVYDRQKSIEWATFFPMQYLTNATRHGIGTLAHMAILETLQASYAPRRHLVCHVSLSEPRWRQLRAMDLNAGTWISRLLQPFCPIIEPFSSYFAKSQAFAQQRFPKRPTLAAPSQPQKPYKPVSGSLVYA